MRDPRARRAEQLRAHVAAALSKARADHAGGLSAEALWWKVSDVFPGSRVRGKEVRHALQALRQAGRVRYARPNWELVR